MRESPLLLKMEIMKFDTRRRISAVISPYKCTQRHSSEGFLFSSETNFDVEC